MMICDALTPCIARLPRIDRIIVRTCSLPIGREVRRKVRAGSPGRKVCREAASTHDRRAERSVCDPPAWRLARAWRLAVLPPRYREAMRQHLPGLCSFAERGRLHGVPLKWLSRSLGARVCYEAATEASTRRMLYSTRGLAPPAYGSVTSLFRTAVLRVASPAARMRVLHVSGLDGTLQHRRLPPHQLSRGTYSY